MQSAAFGLRTFNGLAEMSDRGFISFQKCAQSHLGFIDWSNLKLNLSKASSAKD